MYVTVLLKETSSLSMHLSKLFSNNIKHIIYFSHNIIYIVEKSKNLQFIYWKTCTWKFMWKSFSLSTWFFVCFNFIPKQITKGIEKLWEALQNLLIDIYYYVHSNKRKKKNSESTRSKGKSFSFMLGGKLFISLYQWNNLVRIIYMVYFGL